jgi:hypothetical protein
MKRYFIQLSLLVVCMFIVSGCKKDEADQSADWAKNIETVQKYSAKFPAFKAIFEERLAEAQKSFDDAKGVSDKVARADAMGAANQRINDLFPPFVSYESASKGLTEMIAKHATLPAALAGVTAAAKAAQEAATASVAEAKPTNVGEAKLKIEEATSMLKAASDAVASTDGYMAALKKLNDLMVDKEILNLPAAQVNPALDAAKAALKAADSQAAQASGASALEAKLALFQATKTLNEAAGPLKSLKPAPAAATKTTVPAKPAK